ncbi:histidine kinase [Aliiglaciecola sp. CAU 1673]|uniref:sensor histidine kinase n=1 Tax=Aliiglaciecola sp. CAU 1673 TaxID=3032595 RepID=UPI0023DB9F82|nr:histidine kinase [Aliiglaciecola sp. CAU 1673]MDF2177946.1 histidine kinase [Aliiglaciecola sp. CAU 1673]
MTDALPVVSRWVKLCILGLILGGGYFVAMGLKGSGQWWLATTWLLLTLLSTLMTGSYVSKGHQAIWALLLVLVTLMTVQIHQHLTMLYLVVCLLAIETQPKPTAMFWVSLSIASVFGTELFYSPSPSSVQDAIVNGLLVLFISGFAFLRSEAEQGRQKNRQLLDELEDKNLQLASFIAEHERQSRLQERQHLSRELHDTLGHRLTTSIVQLEAAEKYLDLEPQRVKSILPTVRSVLKDGLAETRNIVRLLDQDKFGRQSLEDLVRPMVSAFKSATGLTIDLQLTCDSSCMSDQRKVHVLRIVQEAMTNISRHANATSANINISSVKAGSAIEVLVEDNGVRLDNFQGQPLPCVKSIESRVAELNGELTFTREDGVTRLRVLVPAGI